MTEIKQANLKTNDYDPTHAPFPIPNYTVLNPPKKQLHIWKTHNNIEKKN